VMVGGTGLYIRAFCEGMDLIPNVPGEIRQQVIEAYNTHGMEWLQAEVEKTDPEFYKVGEVQNPQRMMRALEVMRATGKSILEFRKGRKATRDFAIKKIALELPKEELHRNINARVDQMMQAGLLEEVRSLIPYQHLNALNTVGYKELFDYFNGVNNLEKAVEEIKKNTRQYAKRQLTWFRKDQYEWINTNDLNVNNISKI
jgi:tRNA dimethylallyltransferase